MLSIEDQIRELDRQQQELTAKRQKLKEAKEKLFMEKVKEDSKHSMMHYWVTGGRVPGHDQIWFQVECQTSEYIKVRGPERSGFVLEIFPSMISPVTYHTIDKKENEKQVLCKMCWNTEKDGLVVWDGYAAIYKNGDIRCDSPQCPEFWMSLSAN